jgi:hypothetical protein
MLAQGRDPNWERRYHDLRSELQSAGERGSELLELARSLLHFWESAELPAVAIKECLKTVPERGRCRIANMVVREAADRRLSKAALNILLESAAEGPRYLQPLLGEGLTKVEEIFKEEVDRLEAQRDLAVGRDRADPDAEIKLLAKSGVVGFFASEEARCSDRLNRLNAAAGSIGKDGWKANEELAVCLISLALHSEKHQWQSARDVFRTIRDSADCIERERAKLSINEAIEIVKIYQGEAQSKKSHKAEAQVYAAGLKRLEEWYKTWNREGPKSSVKLVRVAPIDELKCLLSGDAKQIAGVKDRLHHLSAVLKDEANPALLEAITRAVAGREIQLLSRYLLPALRSGCTLLRVEILRSLAQHPELKGVVALECLEIVCGIEGVVRPTQDVRESARSLIKEISDFSAIFQAGLDDQMRFVRGISGAYSFQIGFFSGESELREFCNTHVLSWPVRSEAFRFLQVCQRSGVIGRTSQKFGKKPEPLFYDNFLRRCTPEEISSLTADYPETISWVIDAIRRPGFSPAQISAAASWVVTKAQTSDVLWWNTAKSVQVAPLPVETAFVKEYFARREWGIGFMLALRMVIESEAANADEDMTLRTAMLARRLSEPRSDSEWVMHQRGEELMRTVPVAEREKVIDFAGNTVRRTWGDIPFVIRVWERVRSWFISGLPELPLARGP